MFYILYLYFIIGITFIYFVSCPETASGCEILNLTNKQTSSPSCPHDAWLLGGVLPPFLLSRRDGPPSSALGLLELVKEVSYTPVALGAVTAPSRKEGYWGSAREQEVWVPLSLSPFFFACV